MSGALETAVEKWKTALDKETADLITPGVVASAINDIRFEAGCLPASELPEQLYSLLQDAKSRIAKGNGDSREFNVKALRRTMINALVSMTALATNS